MEGEPGQSALNQIVLGSETAVQVIEPRGQGVGVDRADSIIFVFLHADTDVDEAPGERFGIVSVEASDQALQSIFVEEIQGQKRQRSGVILRVWLSVRRTPSSQVEIVEDASFGDGIVHQVTDADVTMLDAVDPQSPVTYHGMSTRLWSGGHCEKTYRRMCPKTRSTCAPRRDT